LEVTCQDGERARILSAIGETHRLALVQAKRGALPVQGEAFVVPVGVELIASAGRGGSGGACGGHVADEFNLQQAAGLHAKRLAEEDRALVAHAAGQRERVDVEYVLGNCSAGRARSGHCSVGTKRKGW
jgi:hypothetical protein